MAHFPYSGNILMIGYGSVGRCTMPLIEKHFGMNTLSRVTVVDGHDHRADAQRFIDSRSSRRTWKRPSANTARRATSSSTCRSRWIRSSSSSGARRTA